VHVIILLFFIILSGCNRPDPHPERRDPIYKDIESSLRLSEKRVESIQKELASSKEQIQSAKPQTGETKTRWSAYFDAEKRLEKAQQEQLYYSVRLDSRKKEAQRAYLKSLETSSPWPDPNELEAYQRDKRLREAPRNWDDRLKLELQKSKGKEDSKQH
jgi:hypothetical protein